MVDVSESHRRRAVVIAAATLAGVLLTWGVLELFEQRKDVEQAAVARSRRPNPPIGVTGPASSPGSH